MQTVTTHLNSIHVVKFDTSEAKKIDMLFHRISDRIAEAYQPRFLDADDRETDLVKAKRELSCIKYFRFIDNIPDHTVVIFHCEAYSHYLAVISKIMKTMNKYYKFNSIDISFKIVIGEPGLFFMLGEYIYQYLCGSITFHSNRKVMVPYEMKQYCAEHRKRIKIKTMKIKDKFRFGAPRENQRISHFRSIFETPIYQRRLEVICEEPTVCSSNASHIDENENFNDDFQEIFLLENEVSEGNNEGNLTQNENFDSHQASKENSTGVQNRFLELCKKIYCTVKQVVSSIRAIILPKSSCADVLSVDHSGSSEMNNCTDQLQTTSKSNCTFLNKRMILSTARHLIAMIRKLVVSLSRIFVSDNTNDHKKIEFHEVDINLLMTELPNDRQSLRNA